MITENSSKPPLPTALIVRSSYWLHVLLRFLFLLFDLLLQYFVVEILPLRRLMKRRWRGCEQIVNSRAADALLNVICPLTRAPSMIALSCSNTRCCSFLKPVIPNRWTSRRAWSMRTHTQARTFGETTHCKCRNIIYNIPVAWNSRAQKQQQKYTNWETKAFKLLLK